MPFCPLVSFLVSVMTYNQLKSRLTTQKMVVSAVRNAGNTQIFYCYPGNNLCLLLRNARVYHSTRQSQNKQTAFRKKPKKILAMREEVSKAHGQVLIEASEKRGTSRETAPLEHQGIFCSPLPFHFCILPAGHNFSEKHKKING